tara:strand:+ start:370 stop:531 length:162 start_codon:yes stop_codon:yes gene_type:complete
MPGMNERKRYMRGETKTARGDYGKIKGYMGGGKIPGYMHGGGVGSYKKKDRRP